MRFLARLLAWWMPAAAKARACRDVSGDFVAILEGKLRAEPGAGLAAFKAAARETGVRAAARLREELHLGAAFHDVELAWRLVAKSSGMRFTVERSARKTVFRHLSCPVYQTGGKNLCENFCLPLVEGLTEALCPSCRVEMVDQAGPAGPCSKALVQSG